MHQETANATQTVIYRKSHNCVAMDTHAQKKKQRLLCDSNVGSGRIFFFTSVWGMVGEVREQVCTRQVACVQARGQLSDVGPLLLYSGDKTQVTMFSE